MGTRRSRHNQGRKPRYKDQKSTVTRGRIEIDPLPGTPEPTAQEILAKPAWGGMWLNKGFDWTDGEERNLRILCNASISPDASADALGRPPKSIAWQAREIGLELPAEWKALIRPKYLPRPREPKIVLAYPYIMKARDEHADLLAVNALVPRGLSENVRADICQEAMLAIYEGSTTIEELKRNKNNMRYFISKFYKDNFDRNTVSLDMVNDERAYYERAATISHIDWAHNEVNEMRAAYDALSTHVTATQFYDVYQNEVTRAHASLHENDIFVDRDEAEDWLEGSGGGHVQLNTSIVWTNHARERAVQRFPGKKMDIALLRAVRMDTAASRAYEARHITRPTTYYLCSIQDDAVFVIDGEPPRVITVMRFNSPTAVRRKRIAKPNVGWPQLMTNP